MYTLRAAHQSHLGRILRQERPASISASSCAGTRTGQAFPGLLWGGRAGRAPCRADAASPTLPAHPARPAADGGGGGGCTGLPARAEALCGRRSRPERVFAVSAQRTRRRCGRGASAGGACGDQRPGPCTPAGCFFIDAWTLDLVSRAPPGIKRGARLERSPRQADPPTACGPVTGEARPSLLRARSCGGTRAARPVARAPLQPP